MQAGHLVENHFQVNFCLNLFIYLLNEVRQIIFQIHQSSTVFKPFITSFCIHFLSAQWPACINRSTLKPTNSHASFLVLYASETWLSPKLGEVGNHWKTFGNFLFQVDEIYLDRANRHGYERNNTILGTSAIFCLGLLTRACPTCEPVSLKWQQDTRLEDNKVYF